MANGVIAQLDELIDFRRYALMTSYHPQGKGARAGGHLSKFRGRGMDFSEARHYQAGDEVRHMEWRVTARTGRPHVKIFQEERERPVVLLVDFNPSMHFGTRHAFKSVVAARLASLLAWMTVQQGDRIGGLFFSARQHSEFMPRARERAVLPMLSSLSHYTQESAMNDETPARPLSDALLRVRRVVRPGSTIVLISDLYTFDEECIAHLARLRAHNEVLVYHISDPVELALPKSHCYGVTDGKTPFVFNTHSATLQAAYSNYCTQRLHQLEAQCRQAQSDYLSLTTATDLPLLVRRTFLRRAYG